MAPFREGEWVWCRMPDTEPGWRHLPGTGTHIGYILGTLRKPSGELVIAVYTTSQPPEAGSPMPLGCRDFSVAEARQQGQERAFRFDARRIAFLPMTRAFFPLLETPDRGVVGRAHEALRRELAALAAEAYRRDLVIRTGPG